jgi:3-deoxy-manno-octulosonate cytidylyltransferase (CMP-KDO synthetase)
MKTAIVIPARYASTRLPGKPLIQIGGKTMLQRVVEIGRAAAAGKYNKSVTLLVATEDQRVAAHCQEIGAQCVMTSRDCPTGSDRVLEAVQRHGGTFDVIISLQGDAPFMPAAAVAKLMRTFLKNHKLEVATPIVRLNWAELEALREAKKKTPFTGTTVTIDAEGRALWFSKSIIPAIRDEKRMRDTEKHSPVYQHLGLYAYRPDVLVRFVDLPQGRYEQVEGLEQLRLLENGIAIQTALLNVDPGTAQAGIDSPEDIVRAEALLKARGEDA